MRIGIILFSILQLLLFAREMFELLRITDGVILKRLLPLLLLLHTSIRTRR
jgi:hypothetical protein